MTELPEILSTQRHKEVSISNNFQSTSPAAAFGIDWGSTAELILGVFGGIAPDGTEKADTTLTLTGSATNYVEMTTAGVVSSNTSAYTSGRVKLFRITTNADGISSYTDDRSFSPGGLRFAGPSTDNAIARFDGTTGQLQNSVVTISDTGAIAGAISISIAQGAITDPANAFTVSSTWNDAADTFVGTSVDITDTASAAASLISRWRVGGVEKASISKAGLLTIADDLAVNGDALTSTSATFALLNTNVTTLSFAQAATSIAIGQGVTGFGFGGGASTVAAFRFSVARTSSGASNHMDGLLYDCDITGAAGDTSYLTHLSFTGTITTQGAAEVIALATSARFAEPNITLGTGDTITLATTVHIASAPTEGVTNAALSIASGNFLTAGSVHFGSLTAPSSQFDLSAITGGVLTLRRIDASVTANDMVGKIQFYAADTSTTSNFIVADIEAQAVNTVATDINPGRLIFRTTGTGVAATPTERMRLDTFGNVIINTAAIATNATDGFLYVPSCAGTPTGVPTAYTGCVPIVVDTTNHKLYFNDGSWRDAGP